MARVKVLQSVVIRDGAKPRLLKYEIATMICLSPKTVVHHRRSLSEKLGATNDVQLAIIANANGILELVDLDNTSSDVD